MFVRSGAVIAVVLLAGCAAPDRAEEIPEIVDAYLERYFEMYPSRATAAGRHDRDHELENLSPERLEAWLGFQRETIARLEAAAAGGPADLEDELDAELLLRRARLETHSLDTLARPSRDPLFWAGTLGNATVFLLVRDELPEEKRLRAVEARALLIPRLARQAAEALTAADPGQVSAEHCALARRQVEGAANFYRGGLAELARAREGPLGEALLAAGETAATALDELAAELEALGARATGSPHLGDAYAETFRLASGIDEPVASILARAQEDLKAKIAETAGFGRSIWKETFPGETPPEGEREVVERLFARIAEDRARSAEEFVADYQALVEHAIDFLRDHAVIALPEPLNLRIEASPPFFLGQSVGGVYPAGPWAPHSDTLLFLPTAPAGATPEQLDAFFSDFNHHFNVMITPHEFVPGHTLQLQWAARHPRKVRALFGDGVYVEGWGTFCERLMLDLGWGNALARVAHLKKQMENIARTIVDIRVHMDGMSREEVLRFVTEEAMQNEQFAANMWRRSITSAPQLTTYYLGYGQVMGLFDAFHLREFMDGMMAMGPVPVARYRAQMLGAAPDG